MGKKLSFMFKLFSTGSVAISVLILFLGIADYSRGNSFTPYKVEACIGAGCTSVQSNEFGNLLNAIHDGIYSYGDLEILNLCQSPKFVLEGRPLDEHAEKFIEAFEFFGLGNVRMQDGVWEVAPGKNTSGILPSVRKIFLITPANYSCYSPKGNYYIMLFIIFSNLGFFIWLFGVYNRNYR